LSLPPVARQECRPHASESGGDRRCASIWIASEFEGRLSVYARAQNDVKGMSVLATIATQLFVRCARIGKQDGAFRFVPLHSCSSGQGRQTRNLTGRNFASRSISTSSRAEDGSCRGRHQHGRNVIKTLVRGQFMVGGTLGLLAFLGDLFIVCRAAVPLRECFIDN